MYDLKIKTTLNQAEEYFQSAQEAMYKPEEDVVPYTICRNAYRAVQNYLIGYLLNFDLKLNPDSSLKDLLADCKNMDPKFENIQLDIMYDAHEKEDVWMDLAVANSFMDSAEKVRKLVIPQS